MSNGARVYREDKDKAKTFSLGKQPTIFQAEVFGILQVANREDVRNGHMKDIRIYPDS